MKRRGSFPSLRERRRAESSWKDPRCAALNSKFTPAGRRSRLRAADGGASGLGVKEDLPGAIEDGCVLAVLWRVVVHEMVVCGPEDVPCSGREQPVIDRRHPGLLEGILELGA